MSEDKYYVYRHIRLDKGEVFYIGIGTKSRKKNAKSHKTIYERAFSLSGRSNFWKGCSKNGILVEIIFETNDLKVLDTKEIEFIKLYGRRDKKAGTLVNLTDGGRGLLGFKHSKKTMKKVISDKRQILLECKDQVCKLYSEGKTLNDIALSVGRTRQTVRKIIKLLAIPKRGDLRDVTSKRFYCYEFDKLVATGTIKDLAKFLNLSYGGTRNIIYRKTSKKYNITEKEIIC